MTDEAEDLDFEPPERRRVRGSNRKRTWQPYCPTQKIAMHNISPAYFQPLTPLTVTDELPHAAPEPRRPALVQHQCLDCPAWIARGKKVRCAPCASDHSQKQLYARQKRQRDAKKAAKAASA